ncbi:NlpC/P60 family protein [Kitasatospora sp. KL5]|uniref:NlpC/P60 family protein n=1 Tax=Kitasatospora sp. KL5 TaxID=3425125 RepID=UPI003D700783
MADGGGGSAGKVVVGALGAMLAVVMLPVMLLAAIGGDPGLSTPVGNVIGGILDETKIPNKAWITWINQAGMLCPELGLTAPVIAAQIEAESGWDPDIVSPANAKGLSQFIDGTWATWGKDADNDGTNSPFDPPDAIMAQGNYDCHLLKLVSKYIKDGDATGNPIELMLAAYNAGPGAVQQHHGVPPYKETREYILRIRDLITKYTVAGGGPLPTGTGTEMGKRAVAAAMTALGTAYQFGGDCTDPHSSNMQHHCDCSSLMQMAWRAAGVRITRTTWTQVDDGTAVPDLAHLQAGDLLFTPGSDGSREHPGHVGMYMGDGRVIAAPKTGDVVKITPLSQWTGSAGPKNTVVVMRHIA